MFYQGHKINDKRTNIETNFITISKSTLAKSLLKKMKSPSAASEKIFTKHIPDKGLVSTITRSSQDQQ